MNKAKSKRKKLDKKLIYENELARLSFRTEELHQFYETREWIEKGRDRFRNKHEVRPQIKEELLNVAVVHVMKRWRVYEKPITGGLVLMMTVTCLKKYIAKDNGFLSCIHPKFLTNKDENRPEKTEGVKPSWRERQFREDLRIDLKDIERERLTPEGRVVFNGILSGETHDDIKLTLAALGYKGGQHLLYKEKEAIREVIREMGYP